ncbi:hypothetical protein ABRN95_002388 [Listeria monocytogenes]
MIDECTKYNRFMQIKRNVVISKKKRKEIDFQIEILERLINETSKKEKEETQKWLSKELNT